MNTTIKYSQNQTIQSIKKPRIDKEKRNSAFIDELIKQNETLETKKRNRTNQVWRYTETNKNIPKIASVLRRRYLHQLNSKDRRQLRYHACKLMNKRKIIGQMTARVTLL